MNDEFLNAIEKSELSKNTITTYTANYKRLMGLLNDEPILCFTEARLIRRLKELKDIPPMSINGMVSIVMLIRRHNHMPTAKIEKYKLVLSKDHYRDKNINNKELKNKLVIRQRIIFILLKNMLCLLYKHIKLVPCMV